MGTVVHHGSINGAFSIFALVLAKCLGANLKRWQRQVEAMLLRNQNVIWACKAAKGQVTNIFLCGFRDVAEMDRFLESAGTEPLHQYLEAHDLFTFTNNSVIKNIFRQTLQQIYRSSIWSIGGKGVFGPIISLRPWIPLLPKRFYWNVKDWLSPQSE